MKKYKNYLYLIILLFIAAINFNIFLKPLHLVTGGTQGLAIILNKITKLSPSLLILIINLMMLILSYLLLSKKTTLGTILATLIYPLFVRLTNDFNFTFNNIYFNIVTTGIISGTTNGLIYKLNFTAGGINILGPIINKYKNIKIGTINMLINSLILLMGCFIFGLKKCFYSLIVIGINSLIINLIIYKRKEGSKKKSIKILFNIKEKSKIKRIGMIVLFFAIILVVGFTSKSNQKIDENRKIAEKKKTVVVLNEDVIVEVNTEVVLNSFIKEVRNGQIINESEIVDTSKLGNKEVVLLLDNDGDIFEYKFDINIVDTIKPVINCKKELIVYVNNQINLLADVVVTDNSNENLQVLVEGEYNLKKIGEYKLKYVTTDSSNNKSYEDFVLKVIEDPNNRVFTTSKGFKAKVVNGITYIDDILIVNKTYRLPSNYGNGLTNNTSSNFEKMKEDANNLGLNIYIASGYRSYYDQKYIYNDYVKRNGQSSADTYSARPGYSEHQSGLAIDLNSITSSFKDTEEGKWVTDNCYLYGFIIRYPEGKNSITGYIYEPWHLRYVGVELATKLYNSGNWLTLEEYFGIDSKYR